MRRRVMRRWFPGGRPGRALGAAALGLALAGCGGGPAPVAAGPDPCEGGEAHLRQRLGPEFAKLVMKKALPNEGCALVYLRVAEEMPEEMEEGEDMRFDPDHELAFAFSRGAGRVALDTVPRSAAAPGPVMMALATGDLTGDGVPELVIEEKQGEFGMTGYRGLRVFEVSKGAPREAFAQQLTVTTPEGLTMVPAWSGKRVGGAPAIVFDGAGVVQVFAWNAGSGRFVLDPTKGTQPKPEAPPADEAPALVADDPPAKPLTKAEKAAQAKAEKAEKAAQAKAAKAEKAALAKAEREEKAARAKAEREEKAAKAKAAKEEKARLAKEKAAAKKAAKPAAEPAPPAVDPEKEPLDLEALGL
ncbi:MAG: hypothetical protein H6701_14535 [Myxococcales bacterium]|nr:hypothetical protein [Myxococcales bacterium]